MQTKKFLLSIGVLAVFVVLTISSSAFASTNTVNYYGWCCSGTTAQARLRALPLSSYQGSCDILSSTSPSTYVNVIGWTWWQCDTLNSSGTIINSYNFGGYAPSGSSNGDVEPANYCNYNYSPPRCGYTVKASGTHDFNHNGAVNWRPYHSTTGP